MISALADLLAAFLLALPVGMGVGGAGLYVLFLTAIKDVPQLSAQKSNYVFSLCASLSGTVRNLKKGLVCRSLFLFLSLVGLAGALPGAFLATILPQKILRILFSTFMILSGAKGLLKNEKKRRK